MSKKKLTAMETLNSTYTKKTVSKLTWILYATFMMANAGYEGVLKLQSSINVEEGLGTTSVLVIFATSAFSCFCIIPFLLDYLGAKWALLLGEFGFVVYIAGNFYPSWGVLITVSVVHGILESAPWAAISVFVAYFGEQYWVSSQRASKQQASRTASFYVQRGFARFYAVVAFGTVISNSFTTLFLRAFKTIDDETIHNETLPLFANSTTAPVTDEKNKELETCGSNDCQTDYIYNGTEDQLDKFQPSVLGINLLLVVFITTILISMCVQAYFLPNPPSYHEALTEDAKPQETAEMLNIDNEQSHEPVKPKKPSLSSHFCTVLRHVFSPLHLLAMTTYFYYGLTFGYNITEYTRAYVSCTLGVEQVGIAMTVVGLSAGISSAFFSFILPRMGMNKFLVLLVAIHLSGYLLGLFWIPTTNNLWVVYLIGMIQGFIENSITVVSEGVTAIYFSTKLGIAFSIKNLVTNLGIAANGAWSTSLCVYVKIYIQLGFLALSVVTLLGAQIYFKKMRVTKPKNPKEMLEMEFIKN